MIVTRNHLNALLDQLYDDYSNERAEAYFDAAQTRLRQRMAVRYASAYLLVIASVVSVAFNIYNHINGETNALTAEAFPILAALFAVFIFLTNLSAEHMHRNNAADAVTTAERVVLSGEPRTPGIARGI